MRIFITIFTIFFSISTYAQIQQIWLTHNKNSPDSVVVSWCSQNAGDSTVKIGTDKNKLQTYSLKNEEAKNLHHVEVELNKKDCTYFYQVETGKEKSEIYSFKGYPSKGKDLRVAVIGNLGYYNVAKDWNALKNVKEFSDPHLIVSCGDNISALHLFRNKSAPVPLDDIEAFKQMVDKAPEVFRSTIFMPILGNHDKEFRGRYKVRPNLPHCVYDIDATAYRKFFELPNTEWYWYLDLPSVNARIVGVDLCHIRDMGTGHQACHPYDDNSEQYKWYKQIMSKCGDKYVVSLYNSDSPTTRRIAAGIWEKEFRKGSLVISGYGYFMEYAKMKNNNFPYLNTSLNSGDPWFDKANSVYSKQIQGYVLLTFQEASAPKVELRAAKENKSLLEFSLEKSGEFLNDK